MSIPPEGPPKVPPVEIVISPANPKLSKRLLRGAGTRGWFADDGSGRVTIEKEVKKNPGDEEKPS